MQGQFELMIKIYPNGVLTSYIDTINIGDMMEFAHFSANVKLQYPFQKPQIGMLVAGTCITPMIQALHAVLGTPGDDTSITMLYASRTLEDILAKQTLDAWSVDYAHQLRVVHVLSREPSSSDWQGLRGHINRTHIEAYFPPPSSDCKIFVCGTSGFYDTYSGPRQADEVTGLLGDMGYSPEQVYKF
jgi:cytochrome-b5 reductase